MHNAQSAGYNSISDVSNNNNKSKRSSKSSYFYFRFLLLLFVLVTLLLLLLFLLTLFFLRILILLLLPCRPFPSWFYCCCCFACFVLCVLVLYCLGFSLALRFCCSLNTGAVSKATLGKLLRDGVERIYGLYRAQKYHLEQNGTELGCCR